MVGVAAGAYYSLALERDGTVWAWGQNNYGQLGNGNASSSNISVQVSGLTGVTAIAAGDYFGMALKSDGTVWVWGQNDYGQLGNGPGANSNVPVPVSGLTGAVVAIDAGRNHALAVITAGLTVITTSLPDGGVGALYNGTVAEMNGTPPYTWSVTVGALPVGLALNSSTGAITGIPARAGTSNITVQVSDGISTATRALSITVKSAGKPWAWGFNGVGQLGNGTTTPPFNLTSISPPAQVSGLTGVVAIVPGGRTQPGARLRRHGLGLGL